MKTRKMEQSQVITAAVMGVEKLRAIEGNVKCEITHVDATSTTCLLVCLLNFTHYTSFSNPPFRGTITKSTVCVLLPVDGANVKSTTQGERRGEPREYLYLWLSVCGWEERQT